MRILNKEEVQDGEGPNFVIREGIVVIPKGAVILDRLFARGRADDEPEAVLRRLWEYDRATRIVADWFERQALLERVDGDGSVDEVAAEVLRVATHWFERREALT